MPTIQIHLTDQELDQLRGILDGVLGDLRMEVSHTDRKDARDILKHREDTLRKVIETLEEAEDAG